MRVVRFFSLFVIVCLGSAGCARMEGSKSATPKAAETKKAAEARAKAPRNSSGAKQPMQSMAARTEAKKGETNGVSSSAKSETEEKKTNTIKPYEKVITKEAKSDSGLFFVHRLDEKVYFEIPTNEFGKEFLWVSQIERTQAGFGYGGGTQLGSRVVRWELRNKDVLLRDVKYSIRANASDSIRYAVETTSLEPIIRKLSVAAWGTNQSAVIDVTDLFLSDLQEFSAKDRINASGADKSRSFLEGIKSFPDNIETKVLMTYTLSGGSSRGSSTNFPVVRRRDSSLSAVSVVLHHSMVRLPEQPMRPREQDERVGFFSVGFEDYGTSDHQVKNVRYVTRWRLEKKDPTAEISEPKKPIVFYVGRGVPEKWRPWVRKGIEAWQPAFEAAGFKNAIIAKDAPFADEDPDWDAEDARYSTIQWLPSTIENAQGPHVNDPRTGEILEADILMYHNILKLQRDWYFVQVSPLDARAQELPLPDDLMGELLAYVVTHEVGHSIGFPHNMKASSAYSVEQLRDAKFTKEYGTEASIMDYGRFNYVAQPGDGAHLIPVVGPYDFFAVEWGYKEFKDVIDTAEEKPLLEKIVARQIDDPKLRFGNPNAGVDPTQQTEDLGSDAVRATELGLKNIERVAGFLVSATCKEGEDYDLLRNMYTQLLLQRDRELGHVASVVGGVVQHNLWYGQAERIFNPMPADKQREAVAFLVRHAFQTPTNLIRPEILQRLEPSGAPDRILSSQRRLLATLLEDSRCKRMSEHANGSPGVSYLPSDLLNDLHAGIWNELSSEPLDIDLFRRNLQRAYVEMLGNHANRTDAASDLPALARSMLKGLMATINKVTFHAKDLITRAHLEDIAARIDRILDPRGGKSSPDPLARVGSRAE